jgi:predicted PhzF superfamily epimerase YddE/YHI9
MLVPIFQVDAFATEIFQGNPAAVVCLEKFPLDTMMQAIAAENNLAETAFLARDGGDYRLRWFTPIVEVPLFHTASGPLPVHRTEHGYVMNLPARPSAPQPAPKGMAEALGVIPVEVLSNAFNYMVVLENPLAVRSLKPDIGAIACLDRPGVIVTAAGDNGFDFISRYFAPAKGIPEDPVTGAAHCMLAPYWATKLGKCIFHAFQASSRGGTITCRLAGDRVELQGACVFYLEGSITLPN